MKALSLISDKHSNLFSITKGKIYTIVRECKPSLGYLIIDDIGMKTFIKSNEIIILKSKLGKLLFE